MASHHLNFTKYRTDSSGFCSDDEPLKTKSVLLVSQSERLEGLLEGLLDAIEIQVVKASSTSKAWQTLTKLHPSGVIVDLDIEAEMGCSFLSEMRETKRAMKFIAATSSDPMQEKIALDCGANIFFENSSRSIVHTFWFFVATLGRASIRTERLNKVAQIQSDLSTDYLVAYQQLSS